MADLLSPQLVIDSRMLYFGWVPADPDAVRRLLPRELRAQPNRQSSTSVQAPPRSRRGHARRVSRYI
jgi:hypothetical protein